MPDKWEYIKAISALSDEYGNYLVELMDKCGVRNLPNVPEDSAKKFYERLVERLKHRLIKPTRRQKELISDSGFAPENWLIYEETEKHIIMVHRKTSNARTILKGGK